MKLKECCDILLAGGYFRARIPTLSPFDRVRFSTMRSNMLVCALPSPLTPTRQLFFAVTYRNTHLHRWLVELCGRSQQPIWMWMWTSSLRKIQPLDRGCTTLPHELERCQQHNTRSALSDSLVKALIKMKYPNPIQSHQIQVREECICQTFTSVVALVFKTTSSGSRLREPVSTPSVVGAGCHRDTSTDG